MKKLLLLLFIPIVCLGQISSEWTKEELSYADVARDVVFITDVEKDIILYHNLVRLYPKKYLELEILKWRKDIYPKDTIKFNFVWESLDLSSNYYKSLVKTLKKQKPLPKLNFKKELYNAAMCLALEQSESGKIGHNRKKCSRVNYWENCDYGSYNGRDIVNSLLVDEGVPDYGHRKTILSSEISLIGCATTFHPQYEVVAVMDYCEENCF